MEEYLYGRTSMEVRVDTYAESLKGQRRLINTAYLVEVAIDQEGNALEVPGLIRETAEQEMNGKRESADIS